MSKKLLFAIIATICTTTAFADSKTITTQDYVDTNFQTKIPATSSDLEGVTKTLVATTDTAGQVEQMGVVALPKEEYDLEYLGINEDDFEIMNSVVPSYATTYLQLEEAKKGLEDYVQDYMQREIPESGKILYEWDHNGSSQYFGPLTPNSSAWLESYVKGTGLVTKTDTRGIVGERQIIETADVANYGTGTATQQQIQEISIPTMGAVMAAISANAPTLPTGTAGNVVTYNASGQIGGSVATYNGSTTYNASTDASKIAVMSAVQRKMTCARYVQNADQTAENCLLWNVPD